VSCFWIQVPLLSGTPSQTDDVSADTKIGRQTALYPRRLQMANAPEAVLCRYAMKSNIRAHLDAQNGTHILGQLPVNNIVGGIVVAISVQGIVYAGQMAASWLRIT
jgi:hypothetical protein